MLTPAPSPALLGLPQLPPTELVLGKAAPFGGVKFSGHGRENGREALDAYSEVKTVWVSLK